MSRHLAGIGKIAIIEAVNLFSFFGQVFCSLAPVFSLDFQRIWWLCVAWFPRLFIWCVHGGYMLGLEAEILG